MRVIRTRVNLLNTFIDQVDMTDASRRVHDFVGSGRPRQIMTANLDFLRLSVRDHTFRDLINSSDLVVADGMPLVWAARLLGDPLPQRVAGVDLVVECARMAEKNGYGIFLLGAAPGVADKAAAVLKKRFPRLRITGTYSPPSLTPRDEDETVWRIRSAAPDILLVAFGAPKQDQWIRKHLSTLGVPVCIGVGGSFDMLSGRVSRAPGWMQGSGLEWFYRFTQEPGRLWKRYFVNDLPLFARLLVWSLFAPLMTTSSVRTELPGLDVAAPVVASVTEPSRATVARA